MGGWVGRCSILAHLWQQWRGSTNEIQTHLQCRWSTPLAAGVVPHHATLRRWKPSQIAEQIRPGSSPTLFVSEPMCINGISAVRFIGPPTPKHMGSGHSYHSKWTGGWRQRSITRARALSSSRVGKPVHTPPSPTAADTTRILPLKDNINYTLLFLWLPLDLMFFSCCLLHLRPLSCKEYY